MKDVIIIGSSGHASLIIDIIEKTNDHRIIGLLDDFRKMGETVHDYPILGAVNDFSKVCLKNSDIQCMVAVGDNYSRRKIVESLCKNNPSVEFATVIHPSAQIGRNVSIGLGVAIMAGCIINSNSIIGDFAFMNTKSSAGHDMKMEKYASLAPGVTTGGDVSIGECSAVSIGSIVREKTKIGNHSLVGAGSLLLNDCPDNTLMYGVPAKIIRNRSENEQYYRAK